MFLQVDLKKLLTTSLTLLLLDSSLLVMADSHEICLYLEAEKSDPIYSSFFNACIEKVVNCSEKKQLDFDMSESEADEACTKFPLPSDPRYLGGCPELLEQLESEQYDGIDSLPARAALRSDFYFDGVMNHNTTYKYQETKAELAMAIENDPDNIHLLSSHYSYLDYDTEPVETIEFEIRLRELDPDCKYNIPFTESTISNQLELLISTRLEGKPPGNAIVDSNLHDLVTRSWVALETMYERNYKSSYNIEKLRLGIQWVEYSMYFNEDTDLVVSKILGLTKVEQRLKTRKYIESNLRLEYGADSKHGRKESLAMLCNDYAFELGLVNLCIDLIKQLTHIDQSKKEDLQTDIFDALMALTSSATRNCEDTFIIFLHNFHGLHYTETCIAYDRANIIDFVKQMISRFERSVETYEYHLLKAYAYLDESTPDNFNRAILHEDRVILNSLALAKRLQSLSRSGDALAIIDFAIDHARKNDLDPLFYEHRWMRRMGFPSADAFQRDLGDNLTLATLIDAKAQMSNGILIQYEEESNYDRDFQYIPKMYRSQ